MSVTTQTTQATMPVMSPALVFGPAPPQTQHEARASKTEGDQQRRVSEEEVQKIVRDINTALQSMHTELNFSVDKETDKMVLKVINSKTHEVIRQIPAEETLRIAARISKLLGLLIDGNA
jgi:flagellar protein FlaG